MIDSNPTTNSEPRLGKRAAAALVARDPALVNQRTAARILCVSAQRVTQLRQQGKLTVVADHGRYGGFFSRAEVEARRDKLQAQAQQRKQAAAWRLS